MKLIKLIFFLSLFFHTISLADVNIEFDNWKKNFKKIALKNNISEATFDLVMSNTKFLPNVIKYDRYQPEFYEDTKTYISKRTSDKKVKLGKKLYIDPKASLFLIGTVMDYKTDKLSSRFVFNNPKATSSCGCGTSFSN